LLSGLQVLMKPSTASWPPSWRNPAASNHSMVTHAPQSLPTRAVQQQHAQGPHLGHLYTGSSSSQQRGQQYTEVGQV
jgi:hypothetical protein